MIEIQETKTAKIQTLSMKIDSVLQNPMYEYDFGMMAEMLEYARQLFGDILNNTDTCKGYPFEETTPKTHSVLVDAMAKSLERDPE
tara:strand:- start:2061 stop:2318 length:258 start_codon:yes stop_codon:yes gene_type:complete